ncbi:hypothetical protein MERGE_001844 [Pneumocystis wakefieldiae]|uniref:Uncharacterized protein n=1 Tax=Pneumocystis wakefieldiae TaxID=38082 RepID=A0A899FV54_9ASCO|nr:hypothetical protein MERGE_001844 [Pneumocystis wakefieldiae]
METIKSQDSSQCLKKGLRAQRLQDLLDKSLSQTVKACSYEQIAKCFPTLAKNSPEILKNAHEQVISFLKSSCDREFSAIFEERDVVSKLNELDGLITDAKSRQERGDPSTVFSAFLSPEHIINSYLYPLMVKEHLALKNKLEAIQMQNTDFYEKISSQREEIMQLVTFMKKTIEELDLAVQRSIQTPIQTLQTQMDEIVPILQAGL